MQNVSTLKDRLFLIAKGLGMGAANKVPGVSGGVVAFVAGFYEEFITVCLCRGDPRRHPSPSSAGRRCAARGMREDTFTAPFCVGRTFLRSARASKNSGFGWVWWQNLILGRLGPNGQHLSGIA